MRKKNKLYTVNKYNKNFFDDGGLTTKIAAVGQGVGEIVESARQNAQIDDAAVAKKENEIFNTELNATKQYSDLDSLESAMTSWDKIDNVSWRDIRGSNAGQQALSVFNASNAGAQAGSSFGGIGAIVGGVVGALGSGIGSIIGRSRAHKKAEELNNAINKANTIQQNNFANQSSVIQQQRAANLESAYIGADGGLLNLNSDGGNIYIKPSKRGSFTREAEKRGLGVQEFASKVLANKDNYSTAMVKKANFAKNASKWHNDGGPLFTNGAIWSNGITTINNGDTHENNPNDGVQIGVDNEGVPNLVEEGEVIWNDYVFSNRLTLDKQNREKLKLGKKDLTYADAAKKIQKESEERPNDPISKRGLEESLKQLTEMQEVVRAKKDSNNNRFDEGGRITDDGWWITDGLKIPSIFLKEYGSEEPHKGYTEDERKSLMGARKSAKQRGYSPPTLRGFENQFSNIGISPSNSVPKISIPSIPSIPSIDDNKSDKIPYAFVKRYKGYGYTEDDLKKMYEKTLKSSVPSVSSTDDDKFTKIPNDVLNRYRSWGYDDIEDIKRDYLRLLEKEARYKEPDKNTTNAENLKRNIEIEEKEERAEKLEVEREVKKAEKEAKRKAERDAKRDEWAENASTNLRYAPALGNFANVLTDAFGITNKEDYSNADLIKQSVENLSNVTYNPISNYLSYTPFDRNYYSNKLSNQAAATRRAIVENSGLNRAAATAGLLAADYNAQTKLGDLYRQAEEYNLAQRQRVEDFNRGTNMANSEMAMKAALANQKNDELRYKAGLAEAQLREDISRLASSNRNANRSAFLEDLGNIGRENFIFNMINSNPAYAAYLTGSGNVQHRDRTNNNEPTVDDIMSKPGSSGVVTSVSRDIKAKGGKIRRKKGGKYGKLYSF